MMDGTPEVRRDSGLHYRMIADFAYDWETWEDPDGTLRYVSPSCERITGYPAEAFFQDPNLFEALILAPDREDWASHRHSAQPGEPGEAQFRIRRRDGETRWIEHICQPVMDAEKGYLGYRASNRDITQRKRAEEELRRYQENLEELAAERTAELAEINAALRKEIAGRRRVEESLQRSEERYALAQRAANVGSWDWNLQTGELYWSEQIAPMFGLDEGGFEATYDAFLSCVHPEDRQRVMDAVDACVEQGAAYAIDHRVVWPDGSVRWVSETGDVVRDQAGHGLRMMGVVRDITSRKQAEESLRASERFLQSTLDALSANIAILDGRGTILSVNASWRAFAQANGLSWADYGVGRNYLHALAPVRREAGDGADQAEREIKALLSGELDQFWLEYACHSPTEKRWFMMRATRFLGNEGTRVVISHQDVTERKLAEQALQAQSDEVSQRVKELNCLYGISHLVEQPGISFEEILQGTAELVPAAWQHSEICGARILLEGQEFKTANFRNTDWCTAQLVSVSGVPVGSVEACYLEAVPPADQGPFLDGEIDLLRAIAQRLGRIVERVRVAEDLQKAKEAAEGAMRREEERRREAERRGQIAESLAGVLAALNSNQSLDEVLDLIAMQARVLLGTRAVGIYSLEDEAGTLAIQTAQGLLVAYVAGTNAPIGQGALRQAMVSRQPVPVPDVSVELASGADLVLDAERRDRAGHWANVYRALLAVPITMQDQIYGGMLLYYGQPRIFSEEDIELALLFGEQAALAVENARLRNQVERAAATAERSRLARELHDAVTQTLFSASLIAEALPRLWAAHPDEGLCGLEELRELTRGALAEMRTLLLELRPAGLAEKPLGQLLRHLTEAMTSRTRVPISLVVEGHSLLPADQQIALYRISQEALNNISKHSGAGRVSVELRCQPDRVTLCVADDGSGFDPGMVRPDRFGMGMMRERAEGIGAHLEVRSQPGQGTRVMVDWQQERE